MTDFDYLTPGTPTSLLTLAEAERVAQALRRDGLAVLPTETGYMLAALATSRAAVLKAFAVKGRDLRHPMHVACSSLDMAREVSEITPRAGRVLGALTPGPVTVVVRQSPRLPSDLVTANGTVGIRVPDHPATLQIIEAVGWPLTATSLNRAGEPASSIDHRALELLNWPRNETVYVVEDDSSVRFDQPSTLVRLTGSAPEILRTGPISESDVRAVVGPPSSFVPTPDRSQR